MIADDRANVLPFTIIKPWYTFIRSSALGVIIYRFYYWFQDNQCTCKEEPVTIEVICFQYQRDDIFMYFIIKVNQCWLVVTLVKPV